MNEVPLPPYPVGYAFVGSVGNLGASEINDLLAGLWYLNVDMPGGAIRGQILPLPEPATWSLLVSGAASLV